MFKRRLSRRAAVRLISYGCAALVALSLFSAVSAAHLGAYRRQTRADAGRAFEESVEALSDLSRSMEKSLYAADGGMSAKVCAEVYADALRAGTALAALPFSTVEMEELKRFVSLAGDYAYTLCREAAEEGFSEEQRETFAGMAPVAAELAESLRGIRSDLSDGVLTMDSRERQIANVLDEVPVYLSERLVSYAGDFQGVETPVYHGQYTAREETRREAVDEAAARQQAAAVLGCEPEEPALAASYADGGALLFTLGSRSVSVSAAGVESLRDSRLVSESRLDEGAARAAAEEALRALGYGDLKLEELDRRGNLLDLRFSAAENGAAGLDRTIGVTVALDDGSLAGLSLEGTRGEGAQSEWPVSEEEARSLLPAGLELQNLRRVTLAGADGRSIACYELLCLNAEGKQVRLYVNAESGRQEEIRIG